MEDLLLGLGTLSVPCVLYAALAPDFVLDTSGWFVVGLCCAWAVYTLGVYYVVEKTDWNTDEVDANFNFVVVHVLFFAGYVVDQFVAMDTPQQIVMGIVVWLLGALTVGQQWKVLEPSAEKSINEVLSLTTVALLVEIYLIGCFSSSDALIAGVVLLILLYGAYQFISYGVFDARMQFLGAFWVAFFVFQQATHYCFPNPLLWVPIVFMALATFFRFMQVAAYRLASYCITNKSADYLAVARQTFLYFIVLSANLVGNAMWIGGYQSLPANIAFFVIFVALVWFQFAFLYYARDALLIGGFSMMAALTPMVQISSAPGWIPVLIFCLGTIVAVYVWSRPFLPGTARLPASYGFVFSGLTVVFALVVWGAFFATKVGPSNPLQYVQCGVGTALYAVMMGRGAVAARAALDFGAWVVFLFFTVSAALQIGFAVQEQNYPSSVVLLIVYGIVLVSLIVALFVFRDYEIHNENDNAGDGDPAELSDDGPGRQPGDGGGRFGDAFDTALDPEGPNAKLGVYSYDGRYAGAYADLRPNVVPSVVRGPSASPSASPGAGPGVDIVQGP